MMSIFKTSNIYNAKYNSTPSGAEATKEAYDYIIDAVQETNGASAFFNNTVESVEFAQESTVSPTAPRRIVYGTARVGGNIVWRISEETGVTQFAIVWAEKCSAVNAVFFDGINVAPDNNYPLGYFGGSVILENFTGTTGQQNLTDADLIALKPSYWDGFHFFSGCAYSYIYLRFNQTAFSNGFPAVTAEIEGRKLYDPRKDSTAGSILYANSGVSSHRINDESTWQYSDNSVLCLLDYMLDNRLGLGESIDLFDEQSLRDALDICDEGVLDSNNVARKRYTCNGSILANKSHRENIKQILSTMNGKLIYSNGKYYIKPYAEETPHSQIVDESMIVGAITYSAKQGRQDSYNRVKGKFNSLHDGYVYTDYPIQYSSVDADGLTYDDKDGETIVLEYNLPLTTNVEDAQRLARLVMLRSRMQATVTFVANMKALTYKVGDVIQFSNQLLGFTSGLEKEFEITDYLIQNDTEIGITVQITGKEVVPEIYDWQASDATDYTADDLVSAWDGTLSAVTNLDVDVVEVVEAAGVAKQLQVEFDYTDTTQLRHFRIEIVDIISGQASHTIVTNSKENLIDGQEIAKQQTGLPFNVHVYAVSTQGLDSQVTVHPDSHIIAIETQPLINQYNYKSTTLNQPTMLEFSQRFGKPPSNGDKVLVYITDNEGIITDSKLYVFLNEVQHQLIEYVKFGDRDQVNPNSYAVLFAQNFGYTTALSKPVVTVEFAVDPIVFANIDITWSINWYNFLFEYYETGNNAPVSISMPTYLQTSTSADGKKFTVTASMDQYDSFPSWWTRADESYRYKVTATWNTGSAESQEMAMEMIRYL